METDEKLAAAAGAFAEGDFVLFAGAGVSMNPPAGLPNWHTLRDWTIEAVAGRSAEVGAFVTTLTTCEMVAAPGKKGMTPELVASVIARHCPGYFECLRVLEDGSPNENHHRIALLAKMGRVRYIVTTNFDLFIEKALAAHGVPFTTCRTDEEFARFSLGSDLVPDRVVVLKIHGCLSEPDTIIATIEKQARGLSGQHLVALKWLERRRRFVYWGYSGWDLKINLDYLGAVSVAEDAPGFVWSLHRDAGYTETASPYVVELEKLYGERAIVGHDLVRRALDPALLAAGFALPEAVTMTAEEKAEWLEGKARKLREGLARWAEEHVGENEATLIIGDLLEVAGAWEDALACFTKLVERGRAAGDTLLVAVGQHRCGVVRHSRGQFAGALDCLRQAEAAAREAKDFGMVAAALEAQSFVSVSMGAPEQALVHGRQARQLFSLDGQGERGAQLAEGLGAAYEALRRSEEAMGFYAQAEKSYRSSGAKHALCGCLNKQGVVLRNWGEFEAATAKFRESLSIARDIIGDRRTVEEARLFLASVDVVRGNAEAAYEEVAAVVAYARESRSDELLAKSIQFLIVAEHNRGDVARAAELEEELIRILRRMNDRRGLGAALHNASGRLRHEGRIEEALAACEEAIVLLGQTGDQLVAALAMEQKGILYQENLSRPAEAAALFAKCISAHRGVDQDARQFIPALLRRIAVCEGRPRREPAEVVAEALAQEPLVEVALTALYGDRDGNWAERIVGAMENEDDREGPVYDVMRKLQKLAHESQDDSRRSIRYLQAAMTLAHAIGFAEHEASLACDIGWQQIRMGECHEGIPLLEWAAERAAGEIDTDGAIVSAGNFGFGLVRCGDTERGLAVLDQALSLARRTHNRVRMLWLLRELSTYHKEKRSATALAFFAEAITLAEEAADLPLLRDLHFDMGKVYYDTGDYEQALANRLRGLELLRMTQGTVGELVNRLVVIAALCENKLGRVAEAIDYYDEALSQCYRARESKAIQNILPARQGAVAKLKDPDELAHPLYERLCKFYQGEKTANFVLGLEAQSGGFPREAFEPRLFSRVHSVGKNPEVAFGQIVVAFARYLQQTSKWELADTELKIAEITALESKDKQWLASVRRSRADLLAAQGLFDQALENYREAVHVARMAEDSLETELISFAMADVELRRDNLDAAQQHIEEALACARAADYLPGVAHDLVKLAVILERRGKLEAAAQALVEAIPIFREQRTFSPLVGASVQLAELRLQQGRGQDALQAIAEVEEQVQAGGTVKAREVVSGIKARARALGER